MKETQFHRIDAKFQFREQTWKQGIIDQSGAPVFPFHPNVRFGEQSVQTTSNIIGIDDIKSSVSNSESPLPFDVVFFFVFTQSYSWAEIGVRSIADTGKQTDLAGT